MPRTNTARSLILHHDTVAIVVAPSLAPAQARPASAPALSVTVSMERPTTHYYHVVFRADGLKGEFQDFKMPAWTPGYYRIMDYAKNVKDFRAEDGAGRPLAWEKTAKNTWRVRTGRAAVRRRRATTSTLSPASWPTATSATTAGSSPRPACSCISPEGSRTP